jgi:ABC-2 type transport system ATP-binding protein
MMAAILEPDEGTIEIDGINVHTHPLQIKERVAYMPQRFGLYEDLTVEENIYFFGRIYLLSPREIRKRMEGLYAFSRLEPFRDRLAGALSGGMKQKLGLACCLVRTPKVLLLDEPTNGVDPVSRREFWDILYGLLARKVAIAVTTAYLDEAERSNRVALMHNGRFIRLGLPESIRDEKKNGMLEIVVSDSRKAERVLSERGGMRAVRTGNMVRAFIGETRNAEKRIRSLLEKEGILVRAIETARPRLEDSFIDIIGRESR